MIELAEHLQVETVGDVLVVTFLDPELRMMLVESLRPHVLRTLDASQRKVLLDLRHVTFLESTALGLIVQVGAKLSRMGGRLVLCNVDPDVARLFTGPPLFPLAIDICPDRDAALRKLGGSPIA